jgi:hypothetical protein
MRTIKIPNTNVRDLLALRSLDHNLQYKVREIVVNASRRHCRPAVRASMNFNV